MRFSVRDLLLLMVHVAISATIAHFELKGMTTKEALKSFANGCFGAAAAGGGMLLAISFYRKDSLQKLGDTIAELPDERFHRKFLVCIVMMWGSGLFATAVLRHIFLRNPSSMIGLPLGLLLWFGLRRVTLGTHGLMQALQFIPLDDGSLSLDESTAILSTTGDRFKPYGIKVQLTPELAAQVKDLIAAQRGA